MECVFWVWFNGELMAVFGGLRGWGKWVDRASGDDGDGRAVVGLW